MITSVPPINLPVKNEKNKISEEKALIFGHGFGIKQK
ncbi:MAG: Uncharacterised protein [Bacteroidetes bacterium MED-G17]|nr:MAG: Uncharacterised protein [Bacteroidetes bacterium MED-G17]